MPMSQGFSNRLHPLLKEITRHFGTPFHIYDETGIRETGQLLKDAFVKIDGFREFFAVKALPNPAILKIMQSMGFGFDCSSMTELLLADTLGADAKDIMFTSNNTSEAEFQAAAKGCILNLDDITLIPKVAKMPEIICFRYNPGARRTGNSIIGNPIESKYGLTHPQIFDAYQEARQRGAVRFGLHTMLASNELDYNYMMATTRMLLDLAVEISDKLKINLEFINIGGGLGIPYRPEEQPLDLLAMGCATALLFDNFKNKYGTTPKFFMESGRYMTGPHGALVVTAINRKDIYRKYIGVDACMSALMRPGIYGAYHHITVLDKEPDQTDTKVDVVGSLCENNDKFAIQRLLPNIQNGDILMIHDTGAHGHAMGFNYNGKLRPQELLLHSDGSVSLIRRAETQDDYFASLQFTPNQWSLK